MKMQQLSKVYAHYSSWLSVKGVGVWISCMRKVRIIQVIVTVANRYLNANPNPNLINHTYSFDHTYFYPCTCILHFNYFIAIRPYSFTHSCYEIPFLTLVNTNPATH